MQADHGLTSEFRAPIAPGVFAQANITVDNVNVNPDDRGVSIRFGIGGGWAVGLGVSAGASNMPLPPSGVTVPSAALVSGMAYYWMSMTGAARIDSYDGFSVAGRGPLTQVGMNVTKDGRLVENTGLNNKWYVATPSAYAGVLYSTTLTVRFKELQDAYDYAKSVVTHALQVDPNAQLWLSSGP